VRRLVLIFALIGCESRSSSTVDSSSQSAASSSPVASSNPPASTGGSQTGASCGDEVITEEGIGDLRIGATIESIRQKCSVVRDTTVMGPEGMPARKLAVMFSRDTVEAEIVDGRVWRLAVLSPRLRTADSLGVGTSIGRLLQLKNPHGMTGEGQFFVASPTHCGMSFRLAIAEAGPAPGDLDRAGLASLPRSTSVNEVLVFGCHLR